MGRILESVAEAIGHTPLVKLSRISPPGAGTICAKLEHLNPGGSVKDRPALAMLEDAERSGALPPGGLIVEATSGNTGISLAMLAAARGYRCAIYMPDDMSQGRVQVLQTLGAEVVRTPAEAGMAEAVAQAKARVEKADDAWMPKQFQNPANPRAHADTTAAEILDDTGGRFDAFVAGVGTGGTITGVTQALRRQVPGARFVAAEPAASAVLSGGRPGLHGIQGWGAGFVPEVLDRGCFDAVVTVTDPEAYRMTERLAREEGLFVGPSAGANVHAALGLARGLPAGARVVTILCDTGERYLA